MRLRITGLGVLVAAAIMSAAAEPLPDVVTFDDVDPALWGIHNGCIAANRIRHVNIVDNQSALIEMTGGKKILMKFKKRCSGIKQHGFVHTSRNNRFCARFDSLRVLETGGLCLVESLEPFVELEEPIPEIN